jgi:hypothetical protein
MGKEDLGKLIIIDYISYEEIKKDVNVNKEINDEYKSQIISIIYRIRDYDITLFGIAKNNVQQIIEALRHIDVDVLRTYIYSGILAFFCILQFLRLGRNDKNKLQELLVLADKNLQTMEAWVNSIDVLIGKYSDEYYSFNYSLSLVCSSCSRLRYRRAELK